MGNIEVDIIDQTSHHGMGETSYETIYKDKFGNYYIEKFNILTPDDKNIMVLTKRIVNIIKEN